jgi:multicomponent Na+:H+ antiporter subunit B
MSAGARRFAFLLSAPVLGAFLLWGLSGLPPFAERISPYGALLNRVAVAERHATNVVAAVTFDYRGIDTLGEEFILFAAVVGVAILLRAMRGEAEQAPEEEASGRRVPGTSNAVRVIGLAFLGPIVLFGIYITAHGHLTPGGGFQGGVILASAALMVYLSGEYVTLRRVRPESVLDLAESAGAGGYVIVGLAGLITGGVFLANTLLPLGQPGTLLSAGMIPLINASVGLEVAGGFTLLLSEFLEQTLVLRATGPAR